MAELERLKNESKEMIQQLKQLEQQEHELTVQNEILAREALLNGFDPKLLEPLAPKRRKQHAKKTESESAKTEKQSLQDDANSEGQSPSSNRIPPESNEGS